MGHADEVSAARRCALAVGLALAALQTHADSYHILVPAGGQHLAGYHFQTQTIEQIFPAGTLFDGTLILPWNNVAQRYEGPYEWIEGFGWDPDGGHALAPGTIFWIYNPDPNFDLHLVIEGSPPTSPITFRLEAGKANGYAFVTPPREFDWPSWGAVLDQHELDGGVWGAFPTGLLECVCSYDTGRDFPGADGDTFYLWLTDNQTYVGEWQSWTRNTPPGWIYPTWGGTCNPGLIPLGFGAFFYVGQSKDWVQPVVPSVCGD